jgi:hypothetical protein
MTHFEIIENKRILKEFNSHISNQTLPPVPEGKDRLEVGSVYGKPIYRVRWKEPSALKVMVIPYLYLEIDDRYYMMDNLFVDQPGEWCLGMVPVKEEEIHHPKTVFREYIKSQLFNSSGISPSSIAPSTTTALSQYGNSILDGALARLAYEPPTALGSLAPMWQGTYVGGSSKNPCRDNGLSKCSRLLWGK